MELVLWNPGLPETRSTFSCVCKIVSIYVIFFSFIFFFYKGKKYIINIKHTASDSPLNQHWHRVKNVKQNDDNTVQSQSSESSAFKKKTNNFILWSHVLHFSFFFFLKWKHLSSFVCFAVVSNIPMVWFCADFFFFLLNSRKKKVFVNCQWPCRRKNKKDNMSKLNISDNWKKANKPKRKGRHLWSEP